MLAASSGHTSLHMPQPSHFFVDDRTHLGERDGVVEAASGANAAAVAFGEVDDRVHAFGSANHVFGVQNVGQSHAANLVQRLVAFAVHPGVDLVGPFLADVVALHHDADARLHQGGAAHDVADDVLPLPHAQAGDDRNLQLPGRLADDLQSVAEQVGSAPAALRSRSDRDWRSRCRS